MAIQFKEMRPYLARNVRISLCLEETYEYFNYLLKSDIPNKYGELYVYGVGTADVEFSRDVFVEYDETKELNHCGECEDFPCKLAKSYAYDEKQGDQGKRLEQCRCWGKIK